MRYLLALAAFLSLVTVAEAEAPTFTTGPTIRNYGPVADVVPTYTIPKDAMFRHSFDVSEPSSEGQPNRTLVSAARFINMHVRAGIPMERIQLALVIHGQAVKDVSDEMRGSAELVAALIDKGVKIVVCGQSAAYYGIATNDLLPGVKMAISAMTVHALLQQQGYTLNPF